MKHLGMAVVTGASSGIGEATCRSLIRSGYQVYGLARRTERLLQLQKEFPSFQFASLDVRDRTAVEAWVASQKTLLESVTVLVNNAGLAKGVEKMDAAHVEDWEDMIDTNVKGLLYLVRQFLPIFKNNNRGHIVNLGSVAGRWVYPGGAVYCASKFAVRALSEGLRLDLQGTSIRVTNIEPGMVETEFSEVRLGDKEAAQRVYEKMKPLSADDIADTIDWCLSRPAHVNIQELVIFPTDQAGVGFVNRKGSV